MIRSFILVLVLVVGVCLGRMAVSAEPAETDGARHWAFQPLSKPAVPINAVARLRTAIDAFVAAKLRGKSLSFAADADQSTLVRRIYLDLIGLPPSPSEVLDFVTDKSPDSYDRLVDRLLVSPRFGERWGRHWLDVVGFVDTVGFDFDANLIVMPDGKWRYRDYVIQAFNEGKPYDRFLLEQLAGDELFDRGKVKRYTDRHRRLLIATGFWRTAQDFTHEPESNIPLSYYKVLHDTVAIMSNSLLGLTVNCARCHSHKFDPIPHVDYYRMMSLLTTAYNPKDWRAVYPYRPEIKDRTVWDVSPQQKKAIDAHNNKLQLSINPLKDQIKKIEVAAKSRGGTAKSRGGKNKSKLSPKESRKLTELKGKIAALESQRQKYGKIQALFNVGTAPQNRLFKRGDFRTPGQVVTPGFLSVMSNGHTKQLLKSLSGKGRPKRRLALARWLTETESPASALVARVFVNRVWQHMFGRGLVGTEDNFGVQGEKPTHPKLLDWLCRRFIESGWDVKRLIRWMAISTVYRQSSHRPDDALARQADPGNRLLWRMRLRRLESEVIRDALLKVSGELDSTMGGPPVRLQALKDGMVVVSTSAAPTSQRRRSVYLLGRRSFNLTLLTVFDQPQVAINCPRRDRSAVVLQSLTMLNDPFTQRQAGRLAERVMRSAGKNPKQQIEFAFQLVLTRRALAEDVKIGRDYLIRQQSIFRRAGKKSEQATKMALISFCHSLLNTSEFLYAP